MASNAPSWRSPGNAREVLNQLHRILASCRGGNVALASMLYLKIAHIQDRQPLLLEPTSQIQELYGDWPDHINTTAGFSFEVGNSHQIVSQPCVLADSGNDGEDVEVQRRNYEAQGLDFMGIQQQSAPDVQALSWSSSTGDELASTTGCSLDLYEQLQNFDGSFDKFQSSGTLYPWLSGHETVQRPRMACDGFLSILHVGSQ
jgi:hypothetical protein